VIVGMQRDPYFGPLLMFGLGGIYVELFGDVSFRVAPVSPVSSVGNDPRHTRRAAADRLPRPAGADLEAVVDCILRSSQLALDFPEIEEVEVNPLVVYPARVRAGLDASF
jgi:acetate---CoA ligase (ADP-forming)